MRQIAQTEIQAVNGGVWGGGSDPSQLAAGQPGGDLADTFGNATTFRYDDGSTLTVNQAGDVIGFTDANASYSFAFAPGSCTAMAGTLIATFASSGWALVGNGLATLGTAYDCVTVTRINW